ncbi:MAG TPA: SUMF1/EgtB/PvdO family nonheme iron enzyme [Vicinamibacteria bacterium]|nr:SUMF1/EgtB/PvdO family nonheme iron enzyme [Vicinamibacteria bacterium]
MNLADLQAAWARSDRLLSILADDAWLEQPIRLRQPFLFYLGHLPAFAWNQLGRGWLGLPPFQPSFDALFERGIDPVGVDAYVPLASWPERPAVLDYRDRVREALQSALGGDLPAQGNDVLAMVAEHEWMHQETLLYMVQELDHCRKRRPAGWPELPRPRVTPPHRTVEVPDGEAVLGMPAGAAAFGWDNEFAECRVHVPAFRVDQHPVTNADWREFVADGGYAEPRLWREEDWRWRERRGLVRPHGWRTDEAAPAVRSLLADVRFEVAAGWPVQVSWAEACAYARWRGARLPTEAEWQRAAYGTPHGGSRRWPWGDATPATDRANLGFHRGSPLPVGSQPAGASAWGVFEMVGNGWEWTGTPFAPLPGFSPMPRYPGYSADFFDGSHFVLLGGSWATEPLLLRPSFRNWFQPHYPFVFSKLRCVTTLTAV